jgi:hypothetical protein
MHLDPEFGSYNIKPYIIEKTCLHYVLFIHCSAVFCAHVAGTSSTKDLVCGIYMYRGSGVRHCSVFCAHAAGIYEGSGVQNCSVFCAHAASIFIGFGVRQCSVFCAHASTENVVCDIIPSSVHVQPASKKDLVCGIYRGFGVRHVNVRRTCSRHLQRSGVRHYSVFCAHAAGIYEGSGVQHLQRIWCAAWYCSAHM